MSVQSHFALSQLDLMEKIGQEVKRERYLARKEQNARIGMFEVINDIRGLWHLVDTFMNGDSQYAEYSEDWPDEIIWNPIEPHRFCGYLFWAGEQEWENDEDGILRHPFMFDDCSHIGRSGRYGWRRDVGHTRCTDPAENTSS